MYYRNGLFPDCPIGSLELRVYLEPTEPLSRYIVMERPIYGPSGMLRVRLTLSGWRIDGMWGSTCGLQPMEMHIQQKGIELFRESLNDRTRLVGE